MDDDDGIANPTSSCSPGMAEIQHIRQAAMHCLAFWRGCEESSISSSCLHSESSVMVVPRTITTEQQGPAAYEFYSGTSFRFSLHIELLDNNNNNDDDEGSDQVFNVKQLLVGNRTSAIAQFEIGKVLGGWMTLLLKASSGWQCISAVVSPLQVFQQRIMTTTTHVDDDDDNNNNNNHYFLSRRTSVVSPVDFENVIKLVWDGYCAANRACNGQAMAKVFHPTCRLTFVTDNEETKIVDQETFCQMVNDRYKNKKLKDGSDNPHYLYRRLQERNDPRLSTCTSLDAIEFATPFVAMVTLKIGHPPYLWTDYLTVANLQGHWWIVHKTSCHDSFLIPLEDEDR